MVDKKEEVQTLSGNRIQVWQVIANQNLEAFARDLENLLLCTRLDACIPFRLVWEQLTVPFVRGQQFATVE